MILKENLQESKGIKDEQTKGYSYMLTHCVRKNNTINTTGTKNKWRNNFK